MQRHINIKLLHILHLKYQYLHSNLTGITFHNHLFQQDKLKTVHKIYPVGFQIIHN